MTAELYVHFDDSEALAPAFVIACGERHCPVTFLGDGPELAYAEEAAADAGWHVIGEDYLCPNHARYCVRCLELEEECACGPDW